MTIYAVVENNVVTNMVSWDGDDSWEPGSGVAIPIPEGSLVSIGFSYMDGEFTAPPISATETAAQNLETAQNLYDNATLRINSLNEQIEDSDWSGTTEEAVKKSLSAWTDYRKSLRAYLRAADGSKALPEIPEY